MSHAGTRGRHKLFSLMTSLGRVHPVSVVGLVAVACTLAATCCAVGAAAQGAHSSAWRSPRYPTVWPQPRTFTPTDGIGGVTARVADPATFAVSVDAPCSSGAPPTDTDADDPAGSAHDGQPGADSAAVILDAAVERLREAIAAGVEPGGAAPTLEYLRVRLPGVRTASSPTATAAIPDASLDFVGLTIEVSDGCAARTPAELFGVDESYQMELPADGTARLTAATFVGALHGLTTFAQLIVWNGADWIVPNLPTIIEDSPRFAWRGLLVDTARHFLPLPALMHVLDGMAAYKLNVLHLHIVDAQSAPWQSPSNPDFSFAGAMHPRLVYSPVDIDALVAAAWRRGIRVVPEIDMPGHSASWGFGYSWLTGNCSAVVPGAIDRAHSSLERMINIVAIDPTSHAALDFVDSLIGDLAAAFPDPFMHLGGDEVDTRCWQADPNVQRFMRDHGMQHEYEVQSWFTSRALALATKHGRRAVLWEEAFNSGALSGSDAVVNVWLSDKLIPAVQSSGHSTVLSYGGYMDRQDPLNLGAKHWMFFDTWTDIYKYAINNTLIDRAPGVLGGELSAWGENVDLVNIDERLWHRGPALAERLWSEDFTADINDVRNRLAEYRCKLVRRGFRMGPVQPDYCDVAELSDPDGGGSRPNDTRNDDSGVDPAWRAAAIMFGVVGVILVAVLIWRERRSQPGGSHVRLDDAITR